MRTIKLYIIAIVLLCPCLSEAETVKNIKLSYKESDFIKTFDSENKMYIYSHVHHSYYSENTTQPALPYLIQYVSIGVEQDYVGCNYSIVEGAIHSNVEMGHCPEIVSIDDKDNNKRCNSGYFIDTKYPAENVVYTGTHVSNGRKVLSFRICPYVYNTEQHALTFISEIDLSISLSGNNSSESKTYSLYESCNNNALIDMIINSRVDNRFNENSLGTRTNEQVDYLIVTKDSLSAAFTPLVNWKKNKGVRAQIMTTEYIYNHYNLYTGDTQQLMIKRCLKDFHDNHGLQYVLLGGDDTIVPVQYCYAEVTIDSLIKELIPTDLFYSNFQEPFNWNGYANDTIGELRDSVKLCPEIFLTRVPVRNTSHVNAFVNKVLAYEQTPPIENWNDTIFMFGYCLLRKGDDALRGDTLYYHHIANHTNWPRVRLYSNVSDIEQEYSDITADNIQRQLRKGYHFVDATTHGSYKKWLICWDTMEPDYGVVHASSLNNCRPTLISTIACHTNAFDHEEGPCLSEAFIRNENSGVISYYGCSRKGLTHNFGIYLGNGPSEKFNQSYYDVLLSDTIPERNYGTVTALAKALYVGQCNDYNPFRWLMMGINPIGDPEMPVFVAQPIRFENVSFHSNNGNLQVNTGTDSCRICIMSLADNGASYYHVQTNTNNATFSSLPDSCSICITKPGYVPYVTSLRMSNYIQNMTFNGNQIVLSSQGLAGSDVTSSVPQGPVVVESGKSTFQFTDKFVIKNDFKVKSGASLEIRASN